MTPGPSRPLVVSLILGTLALAAPSQGQDARMGAAAGKDTAKQASSRTSGARPARTVLPDPVLLDGSTQPAEERPEQGMIGDFELPGDENVRNGKVGGPQGPQGAQADQQQQQQGMGGLPGLMQSGGGEQGQQGQGGLPQLQQQQQAQGSGSAQGPQDPNGQAGGMQVAQLETDPNAGSGGPEPGPKPQPVAIGDKAMQIKGVPNAPNVVGTQQPSTAQQMEKQVGGGKGSTQIPGGRNAAERGRAMPAGL